MSLNVLFAVHCTKETRNGKTQGELPATQTTRVANTQGGATGSIDDSSGGYEEGGGHRGEPLVMQTGAVEVKGEE